jgi:hypothetical protein
MTRIMRDSDTPTAIPIRGTDIAAGYVTGPGKWPAKAYARFRKIDHAHIDCRGTKPEKAEILDVEPGCTDVLRAMGAQRAVAWVKKRNAVFPGAYPPIIYCNRSTLTPLFNAMSAAGLHVVKDFRLWVTTLDGTKKIRGMRGVIAVQYKRAPNFVNGRLESPSESITAGHYDESIVYDDNWHPGDDLPYTKKEIQALVRKGVAAELTVGATKQEILALVKKGVAAELGAPIGTSGITPAQGAQAAVQAHAALAGVAQQLADLAALVQALPAATAPPTAT